MRRLWPLLSVLLVVLGCSSPAPATDDGGSGADTGRNDDAATPRDDGGPSDGDAALTADTGTSPGNDGGSAGFALPPENGGLDYQLGGAYAPPSGVTIVSRDRTEAPAAGLYNVCYVNGFQIQPGDEAMWMSSHDLAVLRDGAGDPVIDADWNEILLDTRTEASRAEILSVIGPWIDGCAADGFDAVEIDNLDTYSRAMGLLTEDENVTMVRLFADRAHAAGLAIAQKNSSELVPRRAEMGTDFVVSEECNRYGECDAYIGGYGAHVLMIEYRAQDFTAGCSAYGSAYSIVLRDRNLVPAGQSAYVFDGC